MEVGGLVGERLASAAGALAVEEASDSVERVWEADDLQISERALGWPDYQVRAGTTLRVPALDDAVDALSLLRAMEPGVPVHVDVASPRRPPTGAPAVLTVPRYDPRTGTVLGALRITGEPGAYRLEESD